MPEQTKPEPPALPGWPERPLPVPVHSEQKVRTVIPERLGQVQPRQAKQQEQPAMPVQVPQPLLLPLGPRPLELR